ncbi:hypothetical protein P20652_2159 [Pseudoalteromonas sp. BSi20652]|nr:hypothetical protein P20652_2159 [Pseudoalteromonas sp. BSi20652]
MVSQQRKRKTKLFAFSGLLNKLGSLGEQMQISRLQHCIYHEEMT